MLLSQMSEGVHRMSTPPQRNASIPPIMKSNKTLSYLHCPGSETVCNFDAQSFYIVQLLLHFTFTLVTCFANALFLFAMITHPRKLIISHKLLLILSTADLIQGFTIWPLTTLHVYHQAHGQLICWTAKVGGVIGYDLTMVTVFIVFVISIEQYFAVLHPFFYQKYITLKRLILLFIALSMTHNLANFLVNFPLNSKSAWTLYQMSLAILATVLVSSMAVGHVRITAAAKQARRSIQASSVSHGISIRRRARTMKTTFIIVLAFMFAYMPFTAYGIYIAIAKSGTLLSRTYLHPVAELIALTNTVMNPVVYYWRLAFVRKATKAMLGRWLFKKDGSRQTQPVTDRVRTATELMNWSDASVSGGQQTAIASA